jgi:ABC-type polysaccharide/polyol phosphate export permease
MVASPGWSVLSVRKLWQNRIVLFQLAVYDFRHEYLGTWFGFLWAFVHPLLSASILWFVFSHGFRASRTAGDHFFLWLLSGLFAWQFASLSIRGGALSIVQNSFLIRKLAFHVEFLPIVKIISASFLHAAFIVGLLILSWKDRGPDVANFWIAYYWLCALVLSLGIAWLASAATVFVRDFAGVVEIGLQIAFLGTPIFWDLSILPESIQWIAALNPLYYIVTGYRHALLGLGPPSGHLEFWIPALLVFFVGQFVFKKLRPIFADFI